MDRAAVRRPGVPAHRRRRARSDTPDLARTARGWPGRRRATALPEVYLADLDGGGVARLTYWADPRTRWRLDAGRRGARDQRDRAGVGPADLGVRHPGRRGHAAAADVGPVSDVAFARDGARGRRHQRHVAGDGLVEALPRAARPASCGGTATAPASSSGSPPTSTASSPRRWVGRAARADRVPLRPRGLGQPLLAATGRHRPAPPHRPRRRRRARLLRPARRAPTARASSTSPRASCGSSRRWTPERTAPARRAARRAAHRPEPLPRVTAARADLGSAGPHRPGEHRAGPGHRAPAHPPGRPGPHAARRARRAGPAGPAAGRRPRGVGRRRRGRGRGVRRPARRAGRGRGAVAPLRGRGAGAGAGAGRGARTGPPSRWPPTTAGCWCSTSPTARCGSCSRGADGEISDLAWSPDSAWLAWSRPGRVRAAAGS